MHQGGIRDKADSHTTAKREMSSGKKVLEKCLISKPQSEQNYGDFATVHSRSIFTMIAASLRRYAGKVNRPKTSANPIIGTNRNSDTWFWT